jgi:hypothetical protein
VVCDSLIHYKRSKWVQAIGESAFAESGSLLMARN